MDDESQVLLIGKDEELKIPTKHKTQKNQKKQTKTICIFFFIKNDDL